ncbi:MAG: GAF domain-containing protein [Chloroflexota bacterium]
MHKKRHIPKSELNILYLETDQNDLVQALDTLETNGFAISYDNATSLSEYLHYLIQKNYDLVLSTYQLPNCTGLDAFLAGQAKGHNVPFILVTHSLGDIQAVDCLKAGMTDYVLKTDLTRLVTAVSQVLMKKPRRAISQGSEIALRESETRHRIISEMVTDYVYALRVLPDKSFEREWVTEAFDRITGYTPEEMDSNGGWSSIIYPEDLPQVTIRMTKLLAGEQTVDEFRIVTKQGHIRWLRGYGQPVFDENEGHVTHIYGAMQDITARREAEEALLASEAKYATLVEHAGDGVAIFSKTGEFLFVNQAFARIVGYTRDEMLHMFAQSFLTKGGNETIQDLREERKVAGNHKRTYHHEVAVKHKDGSTRNVEQSSTGIEYQGKSTYLVIARDVTERKKTEDIINRRLEELTVIATASQQLQKLQEPSVLSSALIKVLKETLGYAYSIVLLLEEGTDRLLPFAVTEMDSPLSTEAQRKSFMRSYDIRLGKGITGIVAQTGKPINLGNVQQDERYIGPENYVKSELCVPIFRQDEVIGVLNVEALEENAYSASDQRILETLAAQISVAIRNAQLFEQIQQSAVELEKGVADRTRELTTLYNITEIASQAKDIETTLAQILDQIGLMMDCNAGSIGLLSENENTLQLVAHKGLNPDIVSELQGRPIEQTFQGKVWHTNKPFIISDLSSNANTWSQVKSQYHSYLGVPMRTNGYTLGVLSLNRAIGQPPFTEDEITLLSSIADQAGVLIERALLRQQAERAALIEERERLALTLHDSITQSLYSLALLANGGKKQAERGLLDNVADYLADIGTIAGQCLKEMRMLVYKLRPIILEEEGLAGAIQQRLDAVEGRSGIQTRLLVEDDVRLPALIEEELYYIAQEALNNVIKHAAASRVTVQLMVKSDQPGHPQIELTIQDDGCGFDLTAAKKSGGLGLVSMEKRINHIGGMLTIQAELDKGTTVRATTDYNPA